MIGDCPDCGLLSKMPYCFKCQRFHCKGCIRASCATNGKLIPIFDKEVKERGEVW